MFADLFLQRSQGTSDDDKYSGQRNEKGTKENSGGKADERKFDIVDQQEAIGSDQTGGSKVESSRSNLKGSGDNRKQERSSLDKERGSQVDQQLLVVGGKAQETEFFGDGKKLFYGGQVKSVLLKLGKNSVIDGSLEEVKFTNSLNDVVLLAAAGDTREKFNASEKLALFAGKYSKVGAWKIIEQSYLAVKHVFFVDSVNILLVFLLSLEKIRLVFVCRFSQSKSEILVQLSGGRHRLHSGNRSGSECNGNTSRDGEGEQFHQSLHGRIFGALNK